MRRKSSVNRGRWQMQRERCHIVDKTPPAGSSDAVPLGDILARTVHKLGLESPVWIRRLEEEWVALAGGNVAKHARPGRYKTGRLVVFVDSSVWLNELKRYGRAELLTKLQKRFGENRIKTLTLQLDPDG